MTCVLFQVLWAFGLVAGLAKQLFVVGVVVELVVVNLVYYQLVILTALVARWVVAIVAVAVLNYLASLGVPRHADYSNGLAPRVSCLAQVIYSRARCRACWSGAAGSLLF